MIDNKNNWPLEHWLIELCSKCSLECPRCLRQEQGFQTPNNDLSLDWFKANFTGKLLSDVRKITWSGVRGDPIYAKHLLDVMSYVRSCNDKVQFIIITNGSYKTKQWWEKLDSILNEKDNIHFSLDGWDQESNEKYRINSDWKSILTGIETLRNTSAYKTWAFIVFKYNQHKIDDVIKLAKDLNFDEFQLTMSAKFHKVMKDYPQDDPLQPNDEYIASRWRHDRQYFRLSNKIRYEPVEEIFYNRFESTNTTNKNILPICKIGNKGLYINATGEFYPCCWTEPTYNRSLPGGKSIFNRMANNKKSLSEQMNDPRWALIFDKLDTNMDDPNFGMCKAKCNSGLWCQDHATKF